jgi:hypothetical protein
MANRKPDQQPDQQLGRPDNPVPPLETPCTVQDLQNWLKELHAIFPGDSIGLTITSDRNEIEAVG